MSKALAAAGPVLAPTWREGFARPAGRGGDELTALLPLAARRYVITFPAPRLFPVDGVFSPPRKTLPDHARGQVGASARLKSLADQL